MRKTAQFPAKLGRYALPILAATAAVFLLYLSGDAVFHLNRLQNPAEGAALTSLFLLVFCFSLLLPLMSGQVRTLRGVLLCALPAALALYVRTTGLEYVSPDYQYFLAEWTAFFRSHGGFAALGTAVGDYNFPYLYLLAAISYLKLPDLYLIKLFSVFFDLLTAWGGLLLTERLIRRGSWRQTGGGRADAQSPAPLIAYFVLLLLPTVVLNGSCWGQCDGIYSGLVLFSLYFALSDRPYLSVGFLAAAFSFKLQTVFIMPFFLILLFARRMKLRHVALFPAVYLLLCVPALAAGRPFADVLGIYLNQTDSYTDRLTLNAPSLFALFPSGVNAEFWHKAGICAAFLFVLLLSAFLFFRRKTLTDGALFLAALVFALGIPLLLPHMHERYFYLVEVLTVVLACALPGRFYLPIGVQVAALDGYYAYLTNQYQYIYPLAWAALLLLLALFFLLYELWRETGGIRRGGPAAGGKNAEPSGPYPS